MSTFDTLQFANTLKSGNFSSEQAEALARAFASIWNVNLKELATKDDLHREISGVRKDLTNEINDVRREINDVRKDMVAMEDRMMSKMTLRLGSMLVVTVGLMFTLIKVFGI